MQPQEIMQAQIESALAGLTRIHQGLSGARSSEKLEQIGHDLEWAVSHLEDIRHLWATVKASATSRPGEHPALVGAGGSAAGFDARRI